MADYEREEFDPRPEVRFEEGLGTDSDVILDFIDGLHDGHANGERPNQSAVR